MNSLEYIGLLKYEFTDFFDIFENYKIDNYNIPILARSIIRNERYALSKKFVLDAYENYEYCFINYNEANVTTDQLSSFIELLKSSVKTIVKPNEEHMSTTINGIYITDTGFNQEVIEKVRKFKFRKNFTFGLKGWCDIALVLVDLNEYKVYTNKQGRSSKDFYLSILED